MRLIERLNYSKGILLFDLFLKKDKEYGTSSFKYKKVSLILLFSKSSLKIFFFYENSTYL